MECFHLIFIPNNLFILFLYWSKWKIQKHTFIYTQNKTNIKPVIGLLGCDELFRNNYGRDNFQDNRGPSSPVNVGE